MMSFRFRLLPIRSDFSRACGIRAAAISLLVAAPLNAQPALFRKDIAVGDRPSGLVVADFNGDGRPDISIAAGWPRKTLVLLNRGGGAFEPPIDSELACSGSPGDFNGDGKLDLASEGSVKVCLGEGDGTFRVSLDTGILGSSPAVADFNGDGRSDLAVSSARSVTILLGNGDGTFHLGDGLSPGGVFHHPADFNRDGKVDLVVINAATDSLFVFLGTGDGTFGEPFRTSVPGLDGAAFGIQVVDWNRDGHVDVLTARAILLGKDDGSFFSPLRFNDDNKRVYPYPSGVADFDGDGALDVLLSYQGEGDEVDVVSVFAGKGDGTVLRSVEYAAGQQAHGAVTADLDGDSRPDIVVANAGSNSVSLLLNQFGLPAAVSSASLVANTGAPESLMTLSVSTGAPEPVRATPPWPARLGGVSLEIRDSTGEARFASLLYISETQLDFQIPAGAALGPATVFINDDRGVRPVGASIHML